MPLGIFSLVIVSLLFVSAQAKWAQTNGPEGGIIFPIIVSGSALFIGTSGGVYRSVDNGDTWTQVLNGLSIYNVSAFAIFGSSILAGTDGDGAYRSTNNGSPGHKSIMD